MEETTPCPTKAPVEFQTQDEWTEEACDVELFDSLLPAEPASMNADDVLAGLLVGFGTSLADLMVLSGIAHAGG